MDSLACLQGDACANNLPLERDFHSTSVKPTILTSHPARVAMLIFSSALVIFANTVIKHKQDLRKKINAQVWFRISMLLHPVIVGATVYLANITGNEWWGLVGLPFIFNFGAEPMDMSKLPPKVLTIFQGLAYIHHAGPLLGCLSCFSIQHNTHFAIANSLLYSHAWSLHTLGTLDYMKVLNKQKFFWPYMLQALMASSHWWSSIQQQGLEEFITLSTVLPLLVGPAFQYGGRWGLYKYIIHYLGYPRPGDEHYDAFETRKQIGEAAAFILGGVVSFLLL